MDPMSVSRFSFLKKAIPFLGLFLLWCGLPAGAQHFVLASEVILPNGQPTPDFHGISGIEYVPAQGMWVLVGDRHRVFTFDGSKINRPEDFGIPANLLERSVTTGFFESIRVDAQNDAYFFSVEPETTTSVHFSFGRVEPSKARTLLKIPQPFPNKGVEGIALTPTGELWVAPEAGWEGETGKTAERIATTRDTVHFFRYKKPLASDPDADLAEVGRFAYPIDRYAFVRASPTHGARYEGDGRGGIAEILAMGNDTLLVLERCYLKNRTVTASLYLATVDESARRLVKQNEALFDFRTLNTVCNVEGMTWGPVQKNGKRTLWIIADDWAGTVPQTSPTLRNQIIVLHER